MFRKLFLLSLVLLIGVNSCGSKKKMRELEEKHGLKDKEEKKKKHKPTIAEKFAESITQIDLDYHVYNLSDDKMEGRETGTRGQNKAAKYLWDFYMDQQMLFPKEMDGYFQKYTASQNNVPEVVIQTDRKSYQIGEDFISFFPHDDLNINDDEVIYAGYGVDTKRYSDYAYQDVKDKIVLIAAGEPRDKYGNYIISNEVDPYTGRSLPSEWSNDPIHSYILKRNAAMKHGAKVLMIYDSINHDYFWKNYKKYYAEKKIEVNVKKDSVVDFFINKDMFMDITGYERPQDIEYTKKTRAFKVPIDIHYENKNKIIDGINVIAILEADKDNDEYVIVLSHYDGQGKHDGNIYNSANDNATGVAASLVIAEAFKAAIDSGYVPKRNIAFINFSGKEQDMLGSRFYIKHPVIPLDKTIAVVELHKLGRLKNEDEIGDFFPLNISQSGFSKKEFKASVDHIQSYNDHMTLKYKPLVEHSDFFYFMNEHIPTIYFHGSSYKDYHEPGDTAEKVSYEILQKRTQFIFQILWELVYQKKL